MAPDTGRRNSIVFVSVIPGIFSNLQPKKHRNERNVYSTQYLEF